MSLGTITITNPCKMSRRSIVQCGIPRSLPNRLGVEDASGVTVWADNIDGALYFPVTFLAGEGKAVLKIHEWVEEAPPLFTIQEALSQHDSWLIDQFIGSGRVVYHGSPEVVRKGHWVLSTWQHGRPKNDTFWWGDNEITFFRDNPAGSMVSQMGGAGLGKQWSADYESSYEPHIKLQNVQFSVDAQDQELESSSFHHDPTTGYYMETRRLDSSMLEGKGSAFMAAGQKIVTTGRLIFRPSTLVGKDQLWIDTMIAEGTLPCVAVYNDWEGSYGPHGRIAKWHGNSGDLDVHAELASVRHGLKQRAYAQEAWRVDYEISEFDNVGSAGDQPGICLSKYADILRSGNPDRLFYAIADMRAFARRALWWREADGSALQAANHPELQIWSSDPNTRAPGDHIGKTSERPYRNHRRTKANWQKNNLALMGVGFEHYILAPLCQLALITGDHFLKRQVEDMSQLYMSSFTLTGFNARLWSPRAEARSLQFAVWAWEVTQSEELAKHIEGRVKMWNERLVEGEDKAICTEVKGPHHTNLLTPWVQWWQEAMLAEAHEAALMSGVLDNMATSLLVDFEAQHRHHISSCVKYGWGWGNEGKWGTVKAGAWNQGKPEEDPTHDVVYEGNVVVSGTCNIYSGYNDWGIMPVRLETSPKSLDIEGVFLAGRSGGGDKLFERGFLALGTRPE